MKAVDVYLAAADVDEPDPDRTVLDAALADAGIRAAWPIWNAPDVDWAAAAVCYPRMTWDYYADVEGYLRWAALVDEVSTLRNPLDVIRWNIDKRYLLDLAERGVPIVPTALVPRKSTLTVADVRRERGWERVVIKPAVSCGSWETYALHAHETGEPHWRRLLTERDMLVQPFVESVETTGERCAVMIDGTVTHVVRKNPRFAGGVEATSGPFECTPAERKLVEAALAVVDADLDYARVDMVTDATGRPMIAELELIEPSLFFPYSDEALRAFVRVIERYIQQS